MPDKHAATLYEGNCLDILPTLEAGSVDLVLTDPPFGTTHCTWDKQPPWAQLWQQLWRVLKPNGAIIMFAQNPLAAELICMQRKHFRHEWVWEKPIAAGFLSANRAPLRAHELVLVFARKQPTYTRTPIPQQTGKPYKSTGERKRGTALYHGPTLMKPYTRQSLDGTRCPRDVVRYARDPERYGHPTQKPTDLLRMLITQYTHEGELVLDPFCGVGSTLAAAQAEHRRGIGIELDPTFAATTRRRLNL